MEWTNATPLLGYRIARGGSWFDCRIHTRVTTRRIVAKREKSPFIGFRCALSASDPSDPINQQNA
jgi:hypothetical protein